jgi:6-pyruvoyltetrahydropterin/6-carboxytetrahydropterin synthase
MKHQSTKRFTNFSTALRQYKSSTTHCSLLHGYAFEVYCIFECDTLDECGWVADFSEFGRNGIKEWLNNLLDHTTLIDSSDPFREIFEQLDQLKIAKVVFLDHMGCEGLSKYILEKINAVFNKTDGGRNVRCVSCEVIENDKNSGIYKL